MRSLHGDPSLAGEVKFFRDLINGPTRECHIASFVFELQLNMFLDHFSLHVEQNNVVIFSQLNFIGKEGISNTSRVTHHTSVFGILAAHFQQRNDLNYLNFTLTFKLRPSSAGMMSAMRVQLRGFLSPLCYCLFSAYSCLGR